MSRDPEPLTSRDLLIVGLRLIAAWVFTQGFFRFTSYLDLKVFRFNEIPGTSSINPTSYLFYAACDFAMALVLAVGAPNLADWGRKDMPEKPEPREDAA